MSSYTALTVSDAQPFGEGLADVGFEAVDNANGNSIPADGRTRLVVSNASGGNLTITVTAPANSRTANEGLTKTQTVANGDTAYMGPFRPDVFGQPSGADAGLTLIDWSTGTSVTCAAIRELPTPNT